MAGSGPEKWRRALSELRSAQRPPSQRHRCVTTATHTTMTAMPAAATTGLPDMNTAATPHRVGSSVSLEPGSAARTAQCILASRTPPTIDVKRRPSGRLFSLWLERKTHQFRQPLDVEVTGLIGQQRNSVDTGR